MTILQDISISSDLKTTNHVIPAGVVLYWPANTEPTGWFFCYGQEIGRTTYASLFNAIGTTFGAGDGSTTFNLPDCRGRILVGSHTMNGSAPTPTRLTNNNSLGAVGGVEKHVLTQAQMPSHNHGGLSGSMNQNTTHNHGMLAAYALSGTASNAYASIADSNTTSTNIDHQHTSPSDGGSNAHENKQPYLVIPQIIKT